MTTMMTMGAALVSQPVTNSFTAPMERDDEDDNDYNVLAPIGHEVENIIFYGCELDFLFCLGYGFFSIQREVFSRIYYIFPYIVGLVCKNPLYVECNRYSRNILLIYNKVQ